MSYFPAFICRHGHKISSTTNHCSDKYCSKCGAPVIAKCPHCDNVIRGSYDNRLGICSEYEVPAYCRNCGKPYPWTSTAIEATMCMLEESELGFDEQEKLKAILPDVLSETPKTQLAAIRFKKAISGAGSFVAEGLRQFAISFGCEVFKKYLDLP